MLEDRFKAYLDQDQVVKTLSKDLRDAKASHDLTERIDKLKKELKELREKLKSSTEIALMKEKLDGAREKRDLYKEILLSEMAEAGKTELTMDGRKAKIISKVKFEKAN